MWSRARDWLIGAAATVLLLVVAAAVLFWTVSEPADERRPAPPATADTWRGDGRPPADLGQDEVWYASVVMTSERMVAGGSPLRDVRAVGADVVTGPDGLVASRVVLEATVPFEVVTDELGDGTVVRPAAGDQATVIRTVEVLGRELRVVATGTVEVDGDQLVVVPHSIDLGGSETLGEAVAGVVRRLVTITHDIEGLPEGLVLDDVTIGDDGFRVHLTGEGVRLLQ